MSLERLVLDTGGLLLSKVTTFQSLVEAYVCFQLDNHYMACFFDWFCFKVGNFDFLFTSCCGEQSEVHNRYCKCVAVEARWWR